MSRLVSVIVPLYNGRAWIEGALDSLKAQTHAQFEALVIDDGSTDGSGELVRPFLADPRFRYERRTHEGIPRTRNFGLGLSTGAFLAFLDQDDRWLPRRLEASLAALDAAPGAGAAYCGVERIDEAGRSLGLRRPPRRNEGRLFEEFLDAGVAVPLISVLVRREALEATGVFDETLFGTDDFDWLLRLSARAAFARAPEALALQRLRPGTAGQSEPMYLDRFKLADKLRKLWPERSGAVRRFEARARYLYGGFLAQAGRRAEARAQFAAAWRLRPLDWRAAAKWGLSWSPRG